jgi:hypothetical protein
MGSTNILVYPAIPNIGHFMQASCNLSQEVAVQVAGSSPSRIIEKNHHVSHTII